MAHDQTKRLEMVEERLNQMSGGNVLDVATGNGGFIDFLVENLDGYSEITGIDNNGERLEAAKNSHPQANIHFLGMDATRMDFPDDQFDMVCMANSLHHMADPWGVLLEMKRVCKPGGHLVLCEMYRDGQSETQLTHVYLHHWWAAVDRAEGIIHFETFTRQQVADFIGRLGLRDINFYDSNDLASDPKEPELIRELDTIIDRFFKRAEALENSESKEELLLRGELLRLRVHEIGFHGATSLITIGEK